VSIVIPCYGEVETTLRCLTALATDATTSPFEVIVVDDASPDGSGEVLAAIPNIKYLTNRENLGYLRSTNRAASLADGEYLVLLNNDTVPQPGWLDALVAHADRDARVGVVGARMLYPDGRLQDTGIIVWQDASGWNYGRGLDHDDYRVTTRRDVDYIVGACALVRRTLWEAIGGYDDRYAPAYAEDMDLGFSAWAAGFKVRYEPSARVVHKIGVSHGDAAQRLDMQVRNRPVFIEKWRAVLAEQFPPGEEHLLLARDHRRHHALLLCERVPGANESGRDGDLLGALHRLTSDDRFVHVIPDDLTAPQPQSDRLRRLGVEVVHGDVDVDAFIATHAPRLDVIAVEAGAPGSPRRRLAETNAPGVEVLAV
jgi:GT2 family glycosyltransferase